ncbi:MAG: ABC-type polysaccharide/polyol phosphate export system, permease component [Bryobacterales bacterium]|nr:ABC-type polysaccharide/polyol phosphate export system, permease component [Bryobacterales bacterium]
MNNLRTGSRLRRLVYLRDLLRELVVRDMKLRYKRAVLGVGWSLLNPLLQLLVFNFVFTVILPVKVPDFTIFLFIGLLAWGWFQSSLVAATGAIIENPPMIRHPGFPVAILPVASVTSNLINFLLTLPILICFVIAGGHGPALSWLALPILLVVQFLLTLALAYFFAACHVPFRDTQYLLGISLMLGFYLAPTFYDVAKIPREYQTLYQLNPMVHLLGGYRSLFISGQVPALAPLFVIAAASIVTLVFSYSFFVHTSYKFIEEL